MMKKFFYLIAFLLIFPFVTMGQDAIDSINNNSEAEAIDISSSQDISDLKDVDVPTNGMKNIYFYFCNEGISQDKLSYNLNYAVSQGTPFNMCLFMYNDSKEDLSVSFDYVSLSNNDVCGLDNYLEQFITNIDEIKEITVPAGNYVTKEVNLLFPVGIEGDINGCVAYHMTNKLVDTSSNNNGGIVVPVVMRNANKVHFFVGGLDNIKNEVTMTDISTNINDNGELILNFNLNNVGNLENSIVINGVVKNILGFNKSFTIDGKGIQLTPGKSAPVSAVIGSLPSYGGLFKIEFTATATPFFSYDISHSSIDPSLLEDKTFTVSTSYFQMPWLILIIVVLVILFLIVAFRKPKGKNQQQVVYVQAPQQPQAPQQ